LVVYGSSAFPNAQINVSLDGTLQGTTTSTGTGAWSYALGTKSDGAHICTATVTSGGQTSPSSSNFNFTIAPLLTNLPRAIGQNMPSGNHLTMDGFNMLMQNDPTNSQAIIATDPHTLSFYSRYGDREAGGWNTNHTTCRTGSLDDGTLVDGRWNDLDTLTVTMEINFQAASPTGVGDQWVVFEQCAPTNSQYGPIMGELCELVPVV
jgi:hypothetical protein